MFNHKVEVVSTSLTSRPLSKVAAVMHKFSNVYLYTKNTSTQKIVKNG